MKLRNATLLIFIASLLTACNFSLAEDVTPPPGAIQASQSQVTAGPVFPPQAPDLQNGASLYAQECAACHGAQGMADGPMSAQLASQNITVPALGSAEIAQSATPAEWYLMVTRGNIQNFMPPFENKLSEQERWDVVAYALSLSTTPEQVSQGAQLFQKNCAGCPTDPYQSQEKMAALSRGDLIKMLSEGGEGVPALGDTLSQDELGAVAAYLQTLTLGAPSLAAEPASVSTGTAVQNETPAPGTTGTEAPSAEGTPGGTQQADGKAAATAGVGPVFGTVANASGGEVPAGLTVTLHGFDHDTNANTGPQEVLTETAKVQPGGSYRFENVDMPQGRIFLAEVDYEGVGLQSDIVSITPEMSSVELSPITLYENTTDTSILQADQMHIFFDAASDGTLQVIEVYTLSNSSDKTVVVNTDGTNIPFIKVPEGAQDAGFDISQDSAPIVSADNGFAMPPSEKTYGLILFFNLPYTDSATISQPVALSIPSAVVLVPEGIKLKSDQLDSQGIQNFQGSNFEQFNSGALQPGDPLEFSLSGKPASAPASAATVDNKQTMLIGAGVLGLVLILAGVWMFLRDRGKADADDLEDGGGSEDEFETSEEIMDAIIALDDLHRAQKIPEEAYQKRRAELKERLKELA
jgi:mono/diheme cytochrome c family protein